MVVKRAKRDGEDDKTGTKIKSKSGNGGRKVNGAGLLIGNIQEYGMDGVLKMVLKNLSYKAGL